MYTLPIPLHKYTATIQLAFWEKSKIGMEQKALKYVSLLLQKIYLQMNSRLFCKESYK